MKFLKFIIIFFAFFYASTAFAQIKQIFVVEIIFDYGQVKIGEVTNGQGYASDPEKETEMGPYQYWIGMISSSGQMLDLRKFSINNIVSPRPPYPGEVTDPTILNQLDNVNKIISLPYYPDASSLNLYDANNNLIDQKDITYLMPGCGDGKCSDKENYFSCANDCPAGGRDGWCNKGLISVDPDCLKMQSPDISNLQQKSSSKYFAWITLGSIVIFTVIISIVVYIVKKKKTANL